MNKSEIAIKVINNKGGIAKTEDFKLVGINKYEVAELCKKGYIERINRGFYCLPNNNLLSDERLIRELLPNGIICAESALFYYGYSDFSPRKWSIAIPRTASRSIKKIGSFPVKSYYIQKEFMKVGKTIGNFNGIELAIYDRERTICDCFKYRTKLDREMFNKAVNAYAMDKNKNLANLSKYARKMNIYSKVMNVMDILLNN